MYKRFLCGVHNRFSLSLRRAASIVAIGAMLLCLTANSFAQVVSSFTSVFSQNQKGTIVFVSNTLMTCPSSGECTKAREGEADQNNNYSMINIDIDGDGTTSNSSSADFALPSGANVLWAGLYWGAVSTSSSRNTVKLSTPASGGYVSVTGTVSSSSYGYQGFANVTSYVQAGGSGTYMVGRVRNTTGSNNWAGWSLVIVIEDPSMPLRNLTVYNGLALIDYNDPTVTINLSGFKTPLSGPVSTQLGVIVYDGDAGYTGDRLKLNGNSLSNSLNPSSDFFNSTISNIGSYVTTKNPDYKGQLGYDADIVDASNIISNGATSATLSLTTDGESYIPGCVTTSIQLFAPDMQTTKSALDLNHGFLEPGDTLEYTLTAKNIGQDGAKDVILRDTIPDNTTYVAGSLRITAGANSGNKSDGSGDDQAQYDASSNSVIFRLGTGANSSSGGIIALNDSAVVKFKVKTNTLASDQTPVHNQGTVAFTGQTLLTPYSARSFAADTVIVWAADLKVTHTVSPSTIQPNQNAVYSIKIKNYGQKNTTGVLLTDTLPAGLTYVTSSATLGSYNSSTKVWTVGSFALNDSATLSITVTGATNGAKVNTAWITSSSRPEPTPWDNYASATLTVIDTTAPDVPVITNPLNGAAVNTTTPTFTGTAEANSKVRLYVDGVLKDSTTTNGSGAWSKVSATLSQGSHTIRATAVDASGNVSPSTSTNTFTVDTGIPSTPTISVPTNGQTFTTSTPTFSGTAEANSKVRIYINNVLFDSTTANGSGAWTYLSKGFANGSSYQLKISAVDAAGNTSSFSSIRTFNITDSTAPTAPVVVNPANGSFLNYTTPTISGTADPYNKIRIYVDNILKDSVTSDASGAWSYNSAALSQGSHTAKATAVDPANNVSSTSNINTFTIDTTAPTAPVVTAPANNSFVNTTTPTFIGTGEANSKLRIYVDGILKDSVTVEASGNWSKVSATLTAGSHTVKATATDAAGNTSTFSNTNTFTIDVTAPGAPTVTVPTNNSTLTTTTPIFSGTAEANSKVRIYVDGVLKDSTTANGSGNWTDTSAVLTQGSHNVKVTASDAAGNTSVFSNINSFTIDTVAPSAPSVTTPANNSYVNTVTPAFAGTAEANSKVRIYVDGVLKDSVTANGSGNWSATSATLTQASHTIKVTATDAAGNTSEYSGTNTFTVDLTAPSAPTVSYPTNGSSVTTTTPVFSGTAEANSKVRIYVDGVLVDSTTANGSGAWSDTSAILTQGSHNVKVTATDAAGNTSVFSSTITFTVDSIAPSAPTVAAPANGSSTNNTTPTFSGTAEANSKVRLYVDGILKDSVTADGSGNWSKVSATLTAASHTIKATATDAAGNTSGFSNTNTFSVDITAPGTPAVSAPANGSTVSTTTPTFSGTAEANSKVRIYVDGVLKDSVTANGSGAWTATSVVLSQGSHTIKVSATDAAGNTSGFSTTNTFTVDSVPPGAPTVAAPANGSSINSATPTFSGTAEANSKVRIYVDGVLKDSTTADGSGNWSKVSATLSQASHTIYTTATDAAGNTSSNSSTNTFTVDTTAPATPAVSAPANGNTVATTTPAFSGTAEANSKVRIYVDNVLVDSATANGSGAWSKTSATLSQGSHTIKVTATDAAGNTSGFSTTNTFTVDTVAPGAPSVSAPANGSYINTATPSMTGTAEANSKVRIYVDGVLKDSVTANGSGAWSYTSTTLTQASHTVYATATDAAGNTSSASSINTFTVDTTAPSAPSVTAPANGSYVTTVTPAITGTAEANSKVKIYVDGVLKDSVTANGSGAWTYTSTTLTQASHTVYATSTDAAGNTSSNSTTNTFTVDTTAPGTPTVSVPANGSTVTTTTPTFSGTAEANSKVRIYVDNVLVDSVTANGSGAWTKSSATLSQGSHSIKVTATDAAGNTSVFSSANTFTVDSIAPNAPVVSSPANGSYLATTTPTISGTAEANSKVKIYVDGVLKDSVTANGSGAWTYTSTTLSQASHTVYATSTDAAGNTSSNSTTITFTVDTTAPSAPTVSAPANNSTVATTTPTFSGTAEANSNVRIYVDNVLVDSTTANGSGAWSKTSAALSQGSHTIKVTATDAAGNTSTFSGTNTFTVDTVSPNAPVVSAPANGSTINNATPAISGTAEANSKVRIYIDGVLRDSVTANGSGAWTFTSPTLSQASHTVYATATDAAGNTSSNSSTSTFTVDTTAPSAPTVLAPANASTVATTTPTLSGTAEANSKVRIYVDNVLVDSTTANGSGAWSKASATLSQGSHTIKVTATDAAGNTSVFSGTNTFTVDSIAPSAPVVSTPADGSILNTATPTISGTAEANSKVRVYIDGVLRDSATANGSGVWTLTSPSLSQASHTVYATSTDASGNTSSNSSTNSFTIDTTAPSTPAVSAPANGATVTTTTPTFSGTAEANSKVRIYVDNVLVDSTTANGSGAWSKASATLSQGSHSIKVTSTDAAGNTSAFSTANTFTVDSIAPNAPVVSAPANGSSVNTTTPTISGTAEANSKVRIYIDGVLRDSVTANGSGIWTLTSPTLTQTSHNVYATSTDAAGNTSSNSSTSTFTVDTTAPSAPTVSAPANSSIVATTTPTFSGTAEASSKVRIYVDNVLVDSTNADGSGAWSKTSATLSQGSHTIKVTATDAAGNTSSFSGTNTFTVDTVAPGAPVVSAPTNGSTIATTTPTFSGTAEANSKVRIYVDTVLRDSVTANGSGNWSAVSATLNQGSHSIKVTSTDAAGNTSTFSNTSTFTVNTGVPTVPVISAPVNNSSVATTTPVITGAADANDTVKIYVDGVLKATVVTNGSGVWTYTSTALSQGSHTVYAKATNAAGTSSANSPTTTFTVDTVAPSAPVVSAPADGSTVTTTTPTLSGTAEANSKVRIYVDGVLVDSTMANGSGAWSKTSAALSQGSHTVKVTALDAAGNTSTFSNINTFTVDSIAPGTPVVSAPTDGSTVTTTTPTFSGTAEANSKVRIYVDGSLVDSTTANGSGAWSKTSAALSQGSHSIKVTATDAAGNTSGFSNTNTFNLDSIAPSAPVVSTPADGSYETTTTPTFTGTAEANSKVRIYVDNVLRDSVTADGLGAWTKTSAALSQGSHTIKVTATDAAGNTSSFSNTNTFTVDSVTPSAPVVLTPLNGSIVITASTTLTGTAEANSKVRIYIDGALVDSATASGLGLWSKASPALSEGSHSVKVTATDAAGNTSVFSNTNTFTVDTIIPSTPVVSAPADGSTLSTTTPTFSGTAEANSKVRIYVDGSLADSTTASGSGNWSKTSATLSQGSHSIKVTASDNGGNTSAFSNTNTFTIDTVAPNAPVVSAPVDGSTVATTTPTFSGTAEANSKVRIYVDGSLVDSATANGSGAWSKASAALSQGSHSIKVTATDAAGNTSSYSNTNTFTVDTVAPNAPVVSAPLDGSTVTTTTPTFSGTAEANSIVRIYVDGSLVDSTTANGSGAWSKTSASLSQGSHTIKAKAVDAAGNTSAYSNTNTFTVDTVAPNAPVVLLPLDGSISLTATPTFSGTAEANSKVRIYVDGNLVDSTTASGLGLWSKASASLTEGSHTIKVTATDAAGNTSSYSNTNTFTVDTIIPSTPVVLLPLDGSIVLTTTPTFSGTAEANSKVRIYVDGSLVDSTTASGLGAWSKASAALSQGSHTIKVTATDAGGNTSSYSNTNTFTVDTIAPSTPVVLLPLDGSIVLTTTPTFSGTAEANSKVRIYVDGSLVDSTTASGLGAWSKASAALSQGSHTIKVTATDAGGNTSSYSNTNTFTVDTIAPSTPVVLLPLDGSIVLTTTPTFSGTAEANSKVRIYVDGSLVDSTTASGLGTWSKASATLSQGSHTIKVTATDAGGNTSSYSNINTFTIDTVAPLSPVVLTPLDGSTVGTVTPTFTGTAEANSKVRIYVDGSLVDSTTASGLGVWSKVSATLSQGSHSIKVTATDAAGNTSGYSNTNTFTIDTTAPGAPIVILPLDNSIIPTSTPTYSGTAEANSKVRLYVDGTLVDSTTASGLGTWSKTGTSLSNGTHTIKVTASDDAGNTSTFSNTNTFTVDTIVPNAPVVLLPLDLSTVSLPTPTFSGTAEANSKVRLYVDNVLVDSTTANGSGVWSAVSASLAQGSHTIKATATDAAGNTSIFSNINSFIINSLPPPVAITSPANGSSTNNTMPTITGTTSANLRVVVLIDGILIDTVTANGSGNWSRTLTSALTNGPHTVTAIAIGPTGTTAVANNVFTVDTIPPTIVIINPAGSEISTPILTGIEGTAETFCTLVISIDGVPVDTIVMGNTVNWLSDYTGGITDGPHNLTVTATDPAGNTASVSLSLNVDTTPPSVAVSLPADGAVILDNQPDISGVAEPNAIVTVYVDGNPIDSMVATGGTWSTANCPVLSDGPHTTHAIGRDAAGNQTTSATHSFIVDHTAPSVVIVSPADGSSTNNNMIPITGTAEVGSTVILKLDSNPVDTMIIPLNGQWSYTPSSPLTEGVHAAVATATDSIGNSATTTSTFTVDTTPPFVTLVTPAINAQLSVVTPGITGTAEPFSTVKVYVDDTLNSSFVQNGSGVWNVTSRTLGQGSHTTYATATDAAGNSVTSVTHPFTIDTVIPTVSVITPANGSTTSNNTPTLSGTAEPNSVVKVYVDDVLDSTFTEPGSGTWSYTSRLLADGTHKLMATATDASLNMATSSTNIFNVLTVPVLTSISPSTKKVGSPAFTLILSGQNFRPTSVVRLNGVDKPTIYISSTQLAADISTSDVNTIGNKNVTVYTPAPGGGTSATLPLSVTGASVSGIVFYDANRNGVKDASESGLSGWNIRATGSNPLNTAMATSQVNGTYTLSNLPLDFYTVAESLPSGWFVSNPVDTFYLTNITTGSDLTGFDFGNYSFSDTGLYRTFTAEDLIVKKAEKRKCNGFQFTFNFTNKTGRRANGIYIEFNNVVTQFVNIQPFEQQVDLGQNAQDYKFFGPVIDTGVTIQVSGYSVISPCKIRINKWWWLWDDVNISKKKSEGPLKTTLFDISLPMPNTANVRDELFAKGQIISYGLTVGVPSTANSRTLAWVDIRKSGDFYNSLVDKKGLRTGLPRGYTNGIQKGRIVGRLKTFPPSKFDSRLFTELMTLKFNIWASVIGITPSGFGELVFQDPTNPLNGKMIKDIAGYGDTLMTFWNNFPDSTIYYNLDSTARLLNEAFSGPMDTTQFALRTRCSGVRSVNDVFFLRSTPGVAPVTMPDMPDADVVETLPERFELHQNYPNPFNPTTMIGFDLPAVSTVTIKVYDLLGREVTTLLQGEEMLAGSQEVEFDASKFASGMYVYKISATVSPDEDIYAGQTFVQTKKMMLVK